MLDNKLDFKPNDIVKSCKYLEKGCGILISGLHCCVHGSTKSPQIATIDELKNGTVSYESIVNKKKEIFLGINGKSDIDLSGCGNCTNIIQKKFKDVSLDCIGGEPLAGAFNIQHYTMCNERCEYCCYAQNNDFKPPQFDLLQIFDLFKEKGKLKGNNWIDFSGGEPALLKNLDEILTYFDENNMGTVVVYSNATIYSQKIYDLLKANKIILTTSVDTGLKSTYAKLRGLDAFDKVFENLLRYRESGTKNLWLKYVITETNKTDDDLWSFVTVMTALKPDKIMVAPDFPYGDKEIPYSTAEFAAKIWCLCEKYVGCNVVEYTEAMGDPKFVQYRNNLNYEIDKYRKEHPYEKRNSCNCCQSTSKITECDLELLAKKLPTIMKLIKD